jgi:AraC-like DNA-binding protein
MLEDLRLPPGLDGLAMRHRAGHAGVRSHRHAEVEVTLVLRGSATYLLGSRCYQLTPGTLAWLFPAQEHLLVNESADHELWWAVFTPALVSRTARDPAARPLLEADPGGEFSRHLPALAASRLAALFAEVRAAETHHLALANAGLAYLLLRAWQAFRDEGTALDGTGVHPAVAAAARLISADPQAGSLTQLARAAGLSPGHLSRLFKAQTGIPLSRYRNQQRLHRFLLTYGTGQHPTALNAALAAGFGSYAQFYRVCRQETGRTPATLHPASRDDPANKQASQPTPTTKI